jgi:hypothetical protein
MSIYQGLKTAIEGILPAGWALTPYEPIAEMPDATMVTMKVRTVSRLPAAPVGHYRVDWVLTITTKYTSRQTADPALFDDLIDFLTALDEEPGLSWLGWTEAEKTVGDDLERLAYDITIYTLTQKEGA